MVRKRNVMIYFVSKDYDNSDLEHVSFLKRADIKTIINHDADVLTEDGKLLLRFRKNKLSYDNIEAFYENVIGFAVNKTSNRGSASGSNSKNIFDNPKVMSNIIGYFDKFSPSQKVKLKQLGKPIPNITVRETRFLVEYPQKFMKLMPLLKEIDYLYKLLVPDFYIKQKRKAKQTPFHIENTAFTTVTTNVNYHTAVHTDKGDDSEGFGNLTVIEHGKYKGGETCFPQYGIGVDVRTSDILFMDVHQPHGNLPIELTTPDAKRLSIVCYLRINIWEQTRGKTHKFMEKHLSNLKQEK